MEKVKNRTEHNADLCLSYILPSCYSIERQDTNKTVALIMYIFAEELAEYCYEYSKSMPDNTDIYVVTTSQGVIEKCKSLFCNNVEYRMQQNRGRDNTALLITCRDVLEKYDYVCFVHSKTSSHLNNKDIGVNFRKHCFESLLATPSYVENIITTFEKNKSLGILIPFPPNFLPYRVIGNEWMNNHDRAKSFIKNRLKLDIELDSENITCAFGGMFWVRKNAFATLLSAGLTIEDFPKEPLSEPDGLLTHVIERLIPTLAGYDGFSTAYIAPEYYASSYMNDLIADIRSLKKELKKYNSVKYLLYSICKKIFQKTK